MLAPLMKSMPTRIATKTSAVPRSGWRKTRKVGMAMIRPAPMIVESRPTFSRRPDRKLASTVIIRTLLTSLNWKSSPATVIDIWAPNRLVPTNMVRVSSPSTAR